ncbi:MAG TPA: hypothetical protein DDZ55_06435 [Firmicutes bacterium]|nr:hypothetical protein [Bacillota bacterium]
MVMGKKRRRILLLVLLFAFSSSSILAKSKVKLKMWTHHRHMGSFLQNTVKIFNQSVGREKGIEISLRIIGDDAWSTFQEAQRRGDGPDLYSSGFITGYANPFMEGAVAALDDLPGFEEWKAQWPEWYWIEGLTMYQGRIYSIPIQLFNSRLIYNRDLFRAVGRDPDQPPRSYEELKVIAREITAQMKGEAFGFAYCAADSWPMEWMPSQWAEANGDPAYWDWHRGQWAMEGYRRVFQLIVDLQQEGMLFPGAVNLTNDALRAQFAEGRIGMMMGESWDVGVFMDQFPTKCDWAVAPIPTYDGKFHGKSRAMLVGGFWNINNQTRYKLEAWEVIKWFSQYEVRGLMYEQGKNIDSDPVVVREYIKNPVKVRGFAEFAETLDQDYLATYPYLPDWQAPSETPFSVLQDILLQGGDLALELKRIDQLWNNALDRYYKDHPDYERGWNIYPSFDRTIGILGSPQVTAPGIFDSKLFVEGDAR